MKIKYLFLAMAMTVATSASAQFVSNGGKSSGSFSSSSTEIDPKSHFVAEFRVGSIESKAGFGINLGGTKELTSFAGCTLAWDFINMEWAAPFSSPANLDFISAKTGLRLYSPSFAKDKVRLYTNLSMGYTCVLSKGAFSSPLYEFAVKFIELGNTSKFDKWLDSQDYDVEEIEDILEELEDLTDDFERENRDSKFKKNTEEYNEALLNYIGGSGSMAAHHGFGLTFGVGVQIAKKFNVGYSLQYETAFKSKNHFATIGYTF